MNNSRYNLTASVVFFNTKKKDIFNVVNSVLRSRIPIKLYVIDNSPNDNIGENISDLPLEYIFLNKNLGYGKAHNIAIKKAIKIKSDYHIIINPDIFFDTDVIQSLVNRAEEDDRIGLIMPKVLYPDGSVQFLCKLLPTPIDLIFRRFVPLKSIVQKLNNRYELRNMDFTIESETPSLSGCFMFARTSALEKVGGFDERYFMYLEDVDLCRKLGAISKLLYYPDVSVVHNFEKGSYKNKKLLFYHIKSSIQYFNKWGWIFDLKRLQINRKTLKNL